MRNLFCRKLIVLCCIVIFQSCKKDDSYEATTSIDYTELDQVLEPYFGAEIQFNNLNNYANQIIPGYIIKDNTGTNVITNEKATLGRILFYDKNLSSDNTVSCASCHHQDLAFGDSNVASIGVNGATGRHSMRLVNSRFSVEQKFFWDERAATLEAQTTQPIQDHIEMGFSGQDGDLDMSDLLDKLNSLEYYTAISNALYGDEFLTEARLQECLAQFVRSIQSFDSKFDEGLAQTNNINTPFSNYTDQENLGKTLFNDPPNADGFGCVGCHQAPEFDIDVNSNNNGVIGVISDLNATDLTNTKSPSLRNLFDYQGQLNGPLMHDASLTTITDVLNHYNSIDATGNTNLDNRLLGEPGQNGQQLNMTTDERDAVEAFLKTLSGQDVYTNTKWSDPF
ncbi:cytochrome-c peroxidase [Aurantibacter sp.]|uniref:cytochrome-c peroxidase n=1 Tax=Aurantibacter sp. TaxID=2807103 RepID=UPI0035C8579A